MAVIPAEIPEIGDRAGIRGKHAQFYARLKRAKGAGGAQHRHRPF